MPSRLAKSQAVPIRRAVCVAFALLCAVAAALWTAGAWKRLDALLMDAGFHVLRDVAPLPASESIVIVGFDEATQNAFVEPMTLWHRHWSALFKALASARPKAVGLDVLLPTRSFDLVLPGGDAELVEGLLTLREVAPIVLGRSVEAGQRVAPIHAPFLAAARGVQAEGAGAEGFVIFPRDIDGTVRRFEEKLPASRERVPTLAGALARHAGWPVEEGGIQFALGKPFAYVPMHEVVKTHAAGNVAELARRFANKVVLVGGVLPFEDREVMAVPLAAFEPGVRRLPGVLLQAQALRTLEARAMITAVWPWLTLSLVIAAALLVTVPSRWSVSIGFGFALALLVAAVFALRHGLWFAPAGPIAMLIAAPLARVGLEGYAAAQERNRLKAEFGGYVSPAVLEAMQTGQLSGATAQMRRDLSFLFADIRGFTPRSETTSADEIVALLNRYFSVVVPIIHRHGGTVDNFRGDGLMALFGAPNPVPNVGLAALNAARDMLDAVRALNLELEREGIETVQIGVGIAAGEAVAGHVGSDERRHFTAIGDAVNVAARLESLTKTLGSRVVVSDVVAKLAAEAFDFRDLGEQHLRGHTPVRVFAPTWALEHAGTLDAGQAA